MTWRCSGFLAEQNFSTREQLGRRFFPNAQPDPARPLRVCYGRLLQLRQFGLLECRPVILGGTQLHQVQEQLVARSRAEPLAAEAFPIMPRDAAPRLT